MFEPGTLLLLDTRTPNGPSRLFQKPKAILQAFTKTEALEALERITQAQRDGLFAAGYLAYELGFAFEERLEGFLPAASPTPLLWMRLYEAPTLLSAAQAQALLDTAASGEDADTGDLTHEWDFDAYANAFDAVKRYIAAGDAYQVNLTFRSRFTLEGSPLALYRQLTRKQPSAFSAYLHAGDHHVLSVSPELFVEKRGNTVSARPMKGTLGRGRTLDEDEAGRQTLRSDEKTRAENLMIVDLLRNDLARIAEVGSVQVSDLFSVETFRTLHQMTSGISARVQPGLSAVETVRALFPCGSVTGAPKIRAMEIIREVEKSPRGLYTGSIGFIAPDGDFAFNVAIRTAVIDRQGQGVIGAGGGIVADSEAWAEYEEALLKLRFFTEPAEPLGLIETLRWTADEGYFLLERHLARLAQSARYFAFALDVDAARALLDEAAQGFGNQTMRVRLVLDETEGMSVSAAPLVLPGKDAVFRFALAPERLDAQSPYVWHKTTRRAFYDGPRQRLAQSLGVDEAVFCNVEGQVCEGSITSVFVEKDGMLLTPAQSCGLLPGTLRAELLAKGQARETVLYPDDLAAADAVFLGNSVRGLMRAQWMRPQDKGT